MRKFLRAPDLIAVGLALSGILLTPAHGADEPGRVISADLKQTPTARSMTWQECVGAGRVAEGLRDTWRRHLKTCKDTLGFHYLRMHGLLEDELGVYSETADGAPVYNWLYIDDVYDYLLSIGVKPFVELGFMPEKLATRDDTIFWWKGNVTPPKDYAKWDALITALVQHWTARYGADEVKTWRFEVWNEPNIHEFWRPASGIDRLAAYYELYEHTARAVKGVNKDYPVGGPATAGPFQTKELIDLCQGKQIPLDFISFHSYGVSQGPGVDQYGTVLLYLSGNPRYVADTANNQFPVIQSSAMPTLPVHITEWSSSYSPRDPIHDSYFEAPFILEQLRHTGQLASMSYWTFTDVFEENGPVPRPFHGGFGLISFQDIKKPAFWAYDFLAQLGPNEVHSSDPSSYVCTDAKGGAQVLYWDLTGLNDGGKICDQDIFFKPLPAREKGDATVKLSGLKKGEYQLSLRQIGYHQNDPYSRYLEMGSPHDLTPPVIAELKALSSGQPLSRQIVTVRDGAFTMTLPQTENSVTLLTLEPQ